MINAVQLGRQLAEEVIHDPGICLYPGKFHPPHKGHLKAATSLASKNYITEVIVILSSKVSPETGNIAPEQAATIWRMYLQAQVNPKIKIKISEHTSPIQDVMEYAAKAPKNSVIYVAYGQGETDDQEYASSLQTDQSIPKEIRNRIKMIPVQEKEAGLSAPDVRASIEQRDYEGFKKSVPEAAYNKGDAPKIWDMLVKTVPEKEPQPEQPEQEPEEQPQPEQQPAQQSQPEQPTQQTSDQG